MNFGGNYNSGCKNRFEINVNKTALFRLIVNEGEGVMLNNIKSIEWIASFTWVGLLAHCIENMIPFHFSSPK